MTQILSNSETPNLSLLLKKNSLQFRHVTLIFKSLHCSETLISDTQQGLYKIWLLTKMPK